MIICAAVRSVVNGEKNVFKVHRHGDFFLWIKQLQCNYNKAEVESGFIDWDEVNRIERFVSREEAYQIAKQCRQITETDTPGELFSEDLY